MAQATQTAVAELICFEPACRARYAITDVLYACPKCGGLLEATYDGPQQDPDQLKRLFRERRMDNSPINQSGVWRYRELMPFLDDYKHVVTLREGNTPLLSAPNAAKYGGLDGVVFKHQGFNPTGSFKDNGMTAGASQARRLGMTRVACVSTGNTSASMAAYAASAGMEPLIFLPNGKIAFSKLAQALEYGAKTLQVEANFDQILALIRVLAERLGIYLLNSMNPFRVEGQKAIMFEMLDQRDWKVPDWVVLPGGNLGSRGFALIVLGSVVLWCVSRSQASMTQPVNSHASDPVLRIADGRRKGSGGMPSRLGTSRRRWRTARAVDPASSSR